jgi:hypothetical protein
MPASVKERAMSDMTGQGSPLPEFLKCEGEWIVEGYVYLYSPDDTQLVSGSAPRFTMGAARHDGADCVGFDAAQLAAALKVDVATLRAANRARTLIFLGVADVPPKHGGVSAIVYGFQIGEQKASLTIERDQHQGTA